MVVHHPDDGGSKFMTLSENYLGQRSISGEGLQRDAAYKIKARKNS